VLEDWASKFDSVKRWLTKIQKKRMSALFLYHYCYWAETNPNELLGLKDDRSSIKAEELLDTFVADKETGLTESEKYNVVNIVKSFFKHNYRDLARASGAIQYMPKEQYKPTKKDLRKLYRQCYNPRDRSMLTLICSTGVAKETLSNLTWGHLEDDWQKRDIPHISIESELLKGHGRGKYAGVRQETFLTPEAKRDLIEYKEWIEKKMGRTFTKEDNIYIEVKEPFRPLSYDRIGGVFDEMADRAGVPFSPHDARRYVQTGLEEARIPSNWARKIRGRKVRGEEAPYSKPEIDKLRRFYRNDGVPNLQFVTVEAISEEDRRIQATFDNLRLAGFSEDEIEGYKKQRGKTWRTARELITIARQRAGRSATNGGSSDCQKIVSEDELEGYLAQGWQVQAVLPSGKVVISNER
jgi:hypothetical protein